MAVGVDEAHARKVPAAWVRLGDASPPDHPARAGPRGGGLRGEACSPPARRGPVAVLVSGGLDSAGSRAPCSAFAGIVVGNLAYEGTGRRTAQCTACAGSLASLLNLWRWLRWLR